MTTDVGCSLEPNPSAHIYWDIVVAGPLGVRIDDKAWTFRACSSEHDSRKAKVTLTPIIARLQQRGTPAGRHGAFVPAPVLPRSLPHFQRPLRRCPPRCRRGELLEPQRTFARPAASAFRSLLLFRSRLPVCSLEYRGELGPERSQRAEARPCRLQGLPRLAVEAASLLRFRARQVGVVDRLGQPENLGED